MKDKIIARLREIEKREHVKILYAVESGSRGWGFESEDSDYDVRFVYAHPLDWYLSIGQQRDVIEYPKSNMLDISGWDIKKALKLFKNSNSPLYEWFSSPTIYIERDGFTEKLRDLMPVFYSPVSCLYHYLHMAKGNYRHYLKGGRVRIKKYFYVLRPLLACMWVERNKTIPPMEFEKLFQAQRLDRELATEITKLLKRKRAAGELAVGDRVDVINSFLEAKIEYFEHYTETMKGKKPKEDGVLDIFFQGIVKKFKN